MSNPRVALVTCEQYPELDHDDVVLVDALKEEGVTANIEVWSDSTVDWESYDLVVIRSTWDYASRRDDFVNWAKSVPNLANNANIVEWNTDKYYLKDLIEKGVPVVRTVWLDAERHFSSQAIHTRLPAFGDYVIKPTISAGSQDTARYQEATAKARTKAINQVRDMLASGRNVMIQPYLSKIDETGETSVIFINGEYSHSVRKNAMLSRGDAPASQYVQESLQSGDADESFIAVGKQVIAAAHELLNDESAFLYARVDLLPGEEGEPELLELELTEPTLFLRENPEGTTTLAKAIAARVRN
ncbi:ATP-grasp domain-containing protein [Timonella sp. A28]|uniref:ATP-grasp domain-containing protein n=1 Tax=Timonella sp. A28 TaxID=3442640 RepID=UPI003EBB93EF